MCVFFFYFYPISLLGVFFLNVSKTNEYSSGLNMEKSFLNMKALEETIQILFHTTVTLLYIKKKKLREKNKGKIFAT